MWNGRGICWTACIFHFTAVIFSLKSRCHCKDLRPMPLKDFSQPVAQRVLDIEDKSRSSVFAWRGQFSPQFVESILQAYCPDGVPVLDPFAGSGTVLREAARLGLPAYGYEINPSAWSFSKLHEFVNIPQGEREQVIGELRRHIEGQFPIILFHDQDLSQEEIEARIDQIGAAISGDARILFNALVVLLDIFNNKVSGELVQGKLQVLAGHVRNLPCSKSPIRVGLHDARNLPLEDGSVGFLITSPPYINVFNYHQNYRRSVEALGWDPLRVARSEIGSNRANRGNRFLTVLQYCIDIACALLEAHRVLAADGRAVLVVGYESNVLGVPIHNADIVERIALELGLFELELRQRRVFKNRFGKSIREDILNLARRAPDKCRKTPVHVGRNVGLSVLNSCAGVVSLENRPLLVDAIARGPLIEGTAYFDGSSCASYQTRAGVMMVEEERATY